MKKTKKTIVLCLCIVVFMLGLTGCGNKDKKKATYNVGMRKIYVNLITQKMETTSVRFYDFEKNKYTPIPNGKYTITEFKSHQVWFVDENGKHYNACLDSALNDFPESFKLYINYEKTKYDEYTIK